jgi:hypothetical protein
MILPELDRTVLFLLLRILLLSCNLVLQWFYYGISKLYILGFGLNDFYCKVKKNPLQNCGNVYSLL